MLKQRKTMFLFSIIFIVLLLVSCGTDEATNETTDDDSSNLVELEEAKKIYTFSCASCHGNDLSGNVAPSLENIGEKLTEEEIKTIIIEGIGTMPRGLVNEQEAEIVAKWLVQKE